MPTPHAPLTPPPSALALIVAAGSGQRFGSPLPKQYHALGQTSVLGETLARLHRAAAPRRTALVIHPDYRAQAQAALAVLPEDARAACFLVEGGASRQASVRLGLEALAPVASAGELVFIHDAARPLLSAALVRRLIDAATLSGASLPLLPVADTLKRLDANDQTLVETQDRSGLMRAQTPQVFAFAAIHDAHQRLAARDDLTDDASVFEAQGLPVTAVEGDERLLKITSQADLDLVRALLHLEAAQN